MARYNVRHSDSEEPRVSKWSGGTTTELFISPKDSVYADRDFDWRLSTATVDVEESEFTSLSDYNRIIMTFKGNLRLSHNQGEWQELPELTTHAFDGADETIAQGKVTDFNLMLRKGVCTGEVLPYRMNQGDTTFLNERVVVGLKQCKAILIYCYFGALSVSMENNDFHKVEKGVAVIVEGDFSEVNWELTANTNVLAAIAVVR